MSDTHALPLRHGFCAGTRIATPGGEIAVEYLKIGMPVETLHGGVQAIKWIGKRSYTGKFAGDDAEALPIRIRAEALDDGIPARDVIVTPDHGICVDGGLIPAWLLLNGVTILPEKLNRVVHYFHLELDEHEVLIADGCPAESFYYEPLRQDFENAEEFYALYPEPRPFPAVECLPRWEDGFVLQAIQQRLAERAGLQPVEILEGKLRGFVDIAGPEIVAGWAQCEAQPEEPVCLDVLVDGKRVLRALANRYRADLRKAGLGSGKHSFHVVLPPDERGVVEVRRTIDQELLPLAESGR